MESLFVDFLPLRRPHPQSYTITLTFYNPSILNVIRSLIIKMRRKFIFLNYLLMFILLFFSQINFYFYLQFLTLPRPEDFLVKLYATCVFWIFNGIFYFSLLSISLLWDIFFNIIPENIPNCRNCMFFSEEICLILNLCSKQIDFFNG